MKVTIVQNDNVVYVDGVAYPVDCSSLPTYFRAIQWNGVSGEIEFDVDAKGRQLPNLKITDFSPYQYLVEMWEASKAAALKAQVEEAALVRKLAEEREAQNAKKKKG